MRTRRIPFVISVYLALSAPAFAAYPPADTIWRGGPIVTVNDAKPSAEAVAVRDGHIVAVGTAVEVMRRAGRNADGRPRARRSCPASSTPTAMSVMVGFQAVSANLLPPPDGEANASSPTLQNMLREWLATTKLPATYGDPVSASATTTPSSRSSATPRARISTRSRRECRC